MSHSFMSGRESWCGCGGRHTITQGNAYIYRTSGSMGGRGRENSNNGEREKENETHAPGMQALNNRQ